MGTLLSPCCAPRPLPAPTATTERVLALIMVSDSGVSATTLVPFASRATLDRLRTPEDGSCAGCVLRVVQDTPPVAGGTRAHPQPQKGRPTVTPSSAPRRPQAAATHASPLPPAGPGPAAKGDRAGGGSWAPAHTPLPQPSPAPPPRLPARGPQACPGSSGLEGNSAGTRTFFINLLDGLQLLGGPGGDDLRQHLLVRAGALSGHAGVTGEKRVNEAKRKVVFPEQTLPQLQNYIEYPT